MSDIVEGYTPGPWKAEPTPDNLTIWICTENTNVGMVPGYADHPLNLANARLMAAAPAMAAETIRLRKEVERLRAALKPFADLAHHYDPVLDEDDGDSVWWEQAQPTIGDLRRARAAITQERGDDR